MLSLLFNTERAQRVLKSDDIEFARKVRSQYGEETIQYQVLKQWSRGMHILVSEQASRNEVMNLAERLCREDAGKFLVIDIFDSREAWLSRERGDATYPEIEFYKHYLVQIGGGWHDGLKIHWVAERRDH
jgi:hypothetical protein